MKNKSKIIIAVLLMLILLLSTVSFATNKVVKNETNEVENTVDEEISDDIELDIQNLTNNLLEDDAISQDNIEYFDNDIYEIKDEIKLTKMVNGNVYIIAKEININSSIIDGNAYLLGETIKIDNSTINGSVYIAGKDISINANIKDAYIAGETIKIGEESIINRNLRVASDKLDILGIVYDNVYSGADSIYVGDNAKILGELNYSSSEPAVISPTATVNSQNYTKTEEKEDVENISADLVKGIVKTVTVFSIVGAVIKALVVAGILVLISNKLIEKNKNAEVSDYIKNAGKGLILFILIPIFAIILCITLIGAGLGVILILFYIVLIYISAVVASLALASTILKNEDSKWKLYGLTVAIFLVLSLIKLIPVVGGIIMFIFKLIGIGCLFSVLKPNKKEEIVVKTEE